MCVPYLYDEMIYLLTVDVFHLLTQILGLENAVCRRRRKRHNRIQNYIWDCKYSCNILALAQYNPSYYFSTQLAHLFRMRVCASSSSFGGCLRSASRTRTKWMRRQPALSLPTAFSLLVRCVFHILRNGFADINSWLSNAIWLTKISLLKISVPIPL